STDEQRYRSIDGDRLALASRCQRADLTQCRGINPSRRTRSDAYAGAQVLVGRLQPRCGIHRVAVRGVVELPAATHIAHDGGAGLDPDARATQLQRLAERRLPYLLG